VSTIDRESFVGFLQFDNNLHWYGLERNERELTRDMQKLRLTLLLLVDKTLPLQQRLDRIRPKNGRPMVSYLGRAVLTAVLQVVYPNRYGVLNTVAEQAMKRLAIWPRGLDDASEAKTYEAVNSILVRLASDLSIDLWTLDYLWWELEAPPEEIRDRGPVRVQSRTQAKAGRVRGDDHKNTREAGALEPESSGLALPSGLRIDQADAQARMLRFCKAEDIYYDGIQDLAPNRVEPVDVLATIAMNSRVDDAAKIRRVHRGLASQCNTLLAEIPVDADLLTFDPELHEFEKLIRAAVSLQGVLVPVATKVLHRKRRNFIPMLDNVVMGYYIGNVLSADLNEKSQFKATAAQAAVEVLKAFRADLRRVRQHVLAISGQLPRAGFDLTPVRILEVLVWTETEPGGYYRPR
jgi:hypothetical protein